METNLTLRYDKVGDILYIDICSPYPEQESEEIGDDIVARFNPKFGEVENIEILFFSKQLANQTPLQLPVEATLRLVR